jgi:hypothetical protein
MLTFGDKVQNYAQSAHSLVILAKWTYMLNFQAEISLYWTKSKRCIQGFGRET